MTPNAEALLMSMMTTDILIWMYHHEKSDDEFKRAIKRELEFRRKVGITR